MKEKGVDIGSSNYIKGNFNTSRSRTVKYNQPLDIIKYQRRKGPKLYKYVNNNGEQKAELFSSLLNEEKELKINTKYIENIKDFETNFKPNFKNTKLSLESNKLNKMNETYRRKEKKIFHSENQLHFNFLDTEFLNNHENDMLVIRKYMLNLYSLNKNKVKKSESINKKSNLFIFDEDDLYNNTEKCVKKICEFIEDNHYQNKKIQKICFFKEIELNNSFASILDKIFRNITFMKENNVEISKKLIRNLLISEIREKNKNFSTHEEPHLTEKKLNNLQALQPEEKNEIEINTLNQSKELHTQTISNFSGKKTFLC